VTARLRPARAADAAALATILSDWIDATPWMPRIHSRDQDRCFTARLIDEMSVTLAEEAAPLGFIALRDGFVHALYVAADARRRGIGRQLLAAARAEAAALTLWTFQANREARAFYAREGFVEVEAGDGSGNDEGLPDLRLEWHRGRRRPLLGRLTDWAHGRA
jgi:GNAT superfamily N-acetyltransferase